LEFNLKKCKNQFCSDSLYSHFIHLSKNHEWSTGPSPYPCVVGHAATSVFRCCIDDVPMTTLRVNRVLHPH